MVCVYITGGNAGLGRAIAEAFSNEGATIGLIARDEAALQETISSLPGKSGYAVADVSDASALSEAVSKLQSCLGKPDIWVNNAMATVFSRFEDTAPEEFARVAEVTFLGSVYGLQEALRSMKPRGTGHLIQIGSALSYRAIPLQAPYCASKLAIRGAVDSLRCELEHDRSPLTLTAIHMPAMNTPQFDWARRHIAEHPQPVPPIYTPHACAKAVLYSSKHPHLREIWVGQPTLAAILGNKFMPGLMDHYMARNAFDAQFETPAHTLDEEGNLFSPVHGPHAAEGRFHSRQKDEVIWIGTSARREIALFFCLGLLACLTVALLITV